MQGAVGQRFILFSITPDQIVFTKTYPHGACERDLIGKWSVNRDNLVKISHLLDSLLGTGNSEH